MCVHIYIYIYIHTYIHIIKYDIIASVRQLREAIRALLLCGMVAGC